MVYKYSSIYCEMTTIEEAKAEIEVLVQTSDVLKIQNGDAWRVYLAASKEDKDTAKADWQEVHDEWITSTENVKRARAQLKELKANALKVPKTPKKSKETSDTTPSAPKKVGRPKKETLVAA